MLAFGLDLWGKFQNILTKEPQLVVGLLEGLGCDEDQIVKLMSSLKGATLGKVIMAKNMLESTDITDPVKVYLALDHFGLAEGMNMESLTNALAMTASEKNETLSQYILNGGVKRLLAGINTANATADDESVLVGTHEVNPIRCPNDQCKALIIAGDHNTTNGVTECHVCHDIFIL